MSRDLEVILFNKFLVTYSNKPDSIIVTQGNKSLDDITIFYCKNANQTLKY